MDDDLPMAAKRMRPLSLSSRARRAIATGQKGEASGAQERPIGVVERQFMKTSRPRAGLVVGAGGRPPGEGFGYGALNLGQGQARRGQRWQLDAAVSELWRPRGGAPRA